MLVDADVVVEAGVERAIDEVLVVRVGPGVGVVSESHFVIDVAARPEVGADLDNGMAERIGKDVVEVVARHDGVRALQALKVGGVLQAQVAVDEPELRDAVAWRQVVDEVHVAVAALEAHPGGLVDAVAEEQALVHAQLLVVEGIDDGDALVGANLRHVLRAHQQHGVARGLLDGAADALVRLHVVVHVDEAAQRGVGGGAAEVEQLRPLVGVELVHVGTQFAGGQLAVAVLHHAHGLVEEQLAQVRGHDVPQRHQLEVDDVEVFVQRQVVAVVDGGQPFGDVRRLELTLELLVLDVALQHLTSLVAAAVYLDGTIGGLARRGVQVHAVAIVFRNLAERVFDFLLHLLLGVERGMF